MNSAPPPKSIAIAREAVTGPSRAPLYGAIAEAILRTLTMIVVLALAVIAATILVEGAPHLSWEFLSQAPREENLKGGIFPALFGTVFVVLFMIMMALPLGVFGAVYLVEYSSGGILSRITRAAVNNLAGVPSIVFGLFGLGFFILFVGRHLDSAAFGTPATLKDAQVAQAAIDLRRPEIEAAARATASAEAAQRGLSAAATATFVAERIDAALKPPTRRVFGQGAMFWAAATLALLVLPVIIVTTEEALRSVPSSVREAAYGLGATKWQMVRGVVIPQALPGILTGAILAISRGAGELAPVLFVGVAAAAPGLPLTEPVDFGLFRVPVVNPFEPFMHLNYHIYTLATQSTSPEAARGPLFATTLVLVALTFSLNFVAISLRQRLAKKVHR